MFIALHKFDLLEASGGDNGHIVATGERRGRHRERVVELVGKTGENGRSLSLDLWPQLSSRRALLAGSLFSRRAREEPMRMTGMFWRSFTLKAQRFLRLEFGTRKTSAWSLG